LIAAKMRGDVQGRFEKFEIFVKRAEEFVDSSGDSDGLLH